MTFDQAQEGVTQDVGTPQTDVQDSAPESIDTGETQQQEGSAAQEDQPKSKEFNFKQMRENVSRLENERKQWLAERENLRQAAELDRYLRQDPKQGLKYLAQQLGVDLKTLIEANQAAQTQNDLPQINFEQYEPETAKLLKFLHDRAAKVEGLEQWKTEFEQKIEQTQNQTREHQIQQNMSSLEGHLDTLLSKDKISNEKVANTIGAAVRAVLSDTIDPRLASREQLEAAYKEVMEGFSTHKNLTLQNTVTKSVPSSGSRNGAPTTAKPGMTREQRIAELANASKQMFGFE